MATFRAAPSIRNRRRATADTCSPDRGDRRCLGVDGHHAISMSEPMGFAGRGLFDDIQTFGNKASVGGLGAFVAVWTVIMAAMMLPTRLQRGGIIAYRASAQLWRIPMPRASTGRFRSKSTELG